mgnify:CR=1 FL=1
MFRQLIIIILFLFAFKVNAQSGFGPVANCSFPIPEICPNALYPSGTTGTATAAGGSFLCPGSSNGISMNPSFFYFEAGASGSIDILIEPIFVSNVANTISLTNMSEDVSLLKIVDFPLLV